MINLRAARALPGLRTLVVDEQGGASAVRTARIRVGDERSLKRVAARLGGELEVLAPAGARQAAAAWAEAGLAQYR